jgi:hypothetical protein
MANFQEAPVIHPDTLKRIALAGGGFEISTVGMMANTLVDIARDAAQSGRRPQIVVRVESMLIADTMVEIAKAGEGCVMFKFPNSGDLALQGDPALQGA